MSNLTKAVSSFTPNPIFMYNLNTVGYYDPAQVPFDNYGSINITILSCTVVTFTRETQLRGP